MPNDAAGGSAKLAAFPVAEAHVTRCGKQTELQLASLDGGGIDDGNAGFPAVQDRREPCPEKAVSGAQLQALDRTLEHAELMT